MTYMECVEHYLHTLYTFTWQSASEQDTISSAIMVVTIMIPVKAR
jgi:hypothetical protein